MLVFTKSAFRPVGDVYAVEDPATGVNNQVDPSPPVNTTPVGPCANEPAAAKPKVHLLAAGVDVDPTVEPRRLYVCPIGMFPFTPGSSRFCAATIRLPVPTSIVTFT